MTCANFQELEAGLGAANQLTISPIDFPFDNDADLRLDIYNYEDEQWNNVPIATGATLNVGGAGDVFYSWEVFDDNGQRAVRTVLATAGTTPALPAGGTASHPLVPANNNYPVEGGVGVNVRLYRMTSIDRGDMPATFYPGSAVKAEDLNANFEVLRRVVEESACSTNNITDAAPLLDQRYWNKLDDTIEDGDAWVSDDAHIATTAAGDTRWLNATGGNVIGGDGIDVTEAGGNVTISADLEAAGAGEGGLVFDNAEIRVNVGDGLELTTDGVEVDLADPSGLEFTSGDLRIDANDGCEIVAAGLNAETTAASIVQTGGDNDDPAVRIATTLGTATTNTDLVITGGAGVSVTRNSDTELTIAQTSDNNTTYDLTVPASTTDIRLAGSDGVNDDITITGGTNVTVTRTSATELDIAAADTNTTYTLPCSADSGNAVLTLTGANPASTDPVTITAGNNVTFSSIGAAGFTINSSGGGGGGGGADVVANCVGLNTAAGGPPSDGDLFLVLDSSNMTAAAGTAPGNTNAINNLPETEAAGAPVGGYDGEIQVTVEWDNANTRWQFIRWAVQEPDNRYVLEQGDTMTGPLIMDDTTIQITEGTDTLTLNWPTGTDDRTISFPDNGGTVALTTDVTAANTLQQVTSAGNNTTNNIVLQTSTDVNTTFGSDGSAVFNERGQDVDFRVEGVGRANALFVQGSDGNVGIGTGSPTQALDVSGQIHASNDIIAEGDDVIIRAQGSAGNPGHLVIQEGTFVMTQTIDDNMTASYTLTYPAAGPGSDNRILEADTNGNFSWIDTPAGAIRVEDDGTSIVAAATGLNFTGAGVTVTDSGSGEAEVAIAGGITVEDEGTALATAATTINFTGAGVTATGTGAEKTVNIPGGAGGTGLTLLSNPTHGGGTVGGTMALDANPNVTGGIPPYSRQSIQWQIQGNGGTNWINVSTAATFTIPATVNDGGTNRDTDGGQIRVQIVMQDSTPGTALTAPLATSTAQEINAIMEALRFPTTGCICETNNNGTWPIIEVNSGADTNNVVNVACVTGAGNGDTGWMMAILANGEVWRNTDRTWTSALNFQDTQYDATGKTIAGVVSAISDNSEQVVYTDGSVRIANGTMYDATTAGNSPVINYGGQGNHGTPLFITADGELMYGGLTNPANFQGGAMTPGTPRDIMPAGVRAVRLAAFQNGQSSPWDASHGTVAWIILGDDGFLYTAEAAASFPAAFTNHGDFATNGARRLQFNSTLVTDQFLDVGPYSGVGATWSSGQGFSALRDDGTMWVYSNGTFGTTFQQYGSRTIYTTAFHNGGHGHRSGINQQINSGIAYTTTAGQYAAFNDATAATAESTLLTVTSVTNMDTANPMPVLSNLSGVSVHTNPNVFWFIPRS